MLFANVQPANLVIPRWYQEEAGQALDEHLMTRNDNPCVCLPTGSGKSLVIAWAIQRWIAQYANLRTTVLAHRQELIEQNHAELAGLMPGCDLGIYAAGLRRRDMDSQITFAAIDSIYKKAYDFPPQDVILVDEAHRIPPNGEGKYRSFINDVKTINPNVRVVGFTATPYRLGVGPICHKDHILNHLCYDVNVATLIEQGYLSKLRSVVGESQADVTGLKHNSGGDYVLRGMTEHIKPVVRDAVIEAVQMMNATNRQHAIWFCIDHEHCKMMQMILRALGIYAPMITAKTPKHERQRSAEEFKAGRHRILLNISVYTEGFNAKCVDCVGLFRPTLSAALYEQMVGRAARLFPGKEYSLIMDFAHCIDEHGPVDAVDRGKTKMETCGDCRNVFSRATRKCPSCGWDIPKEQIEREEAAERERKLHEARASKRSILSSEPETLKVSDVTIHRHRKPGRPDSVKVQYRCGLMIQSEYLCFDHDGYAGRKARDWWAGRFGREEAEQMTVDKVLGDLFAAQRINQITKSITVRKSGKYYEILRYELDRGDGSNDDRCIVLRDRNEVAHFSAAS